MTLISADDLLARVRAGDETLRIADVRWYLGQPERGREEYEAGHIPGAVFVDHDTVLSAPEGPGRHPLPRPADLARDLGRLGFGSDHFVVAYDDAGGTAAARLWWMLDDLGHERVAVLDGGLRAWREAGGQLSTEEPGWPAAHLQLADRWRKVIDRQALKPRLGSVVLLDARAAERYRGEVEPVDPVAGHIPTARSAPAAGNLGPDGRFLSAEDLAERFTAAGCTAGPVVSSCGSGTTAAHNALAMRVAGLADPILYPGSYSDWSRSDEPIAVGPEPGSPPA